MATVKSYDLTDAEVRESTFTPYDGPVPKRGLYPAKIVSSEVGQSSAGNDMITVILEITEAPYKGAPLWLYVVFSDAALWKARETVEALGLPLKGTSLEKLAKLMSGKKCRVRVQNEMYNNEMTAKPRNILPPAKAVAAASEEEPDEGDDEELDEDETAAPPPRTLAKAAPKAAAKPARRAAAVVAEEDEGSEEEETDEGEPPF